MVASGVASKGLDFNDIQHVIIFSMPKEIEDYVHQIGRTGRSGKTGIATTFVNMNSAEQTLLDLKYLLMEAGQKLVFKVQLFLTVVLKILNTEFHHSCRVSKIPGQPREDHSKDVLSVEVHSDCISYRLHWKLTLSSGLGHGISTCPKLEDTQRRQMASLRAGQDDTGGY
jgi:ATP-dependent RNA helicase DDX41